MLIAPFRKPGFSAFAGCDERTGADGLGFAFVDADSPPGGFSLLAFMLPSSLTQRFFVDQTQGGCHSHFWQPNIILGHSQTVETAKGRRTTL